MSYLERIAEAYKMMAELDYRPAAPNDGFGNITVPYAELDVDIEAMEYAHRLEAEDEEQMFRTGCTDYTFSRGAVLALEAFRLMNSGKFWGLSEQPEGGPELVPALLRKAAEEYERAVREGLPE